MPPPSPLLARRWPWLLLLLVVAIAYYASYVRYGINFRDEGGTVALLSKRLLDGERPFRDIVLGYNVLWFYPVVGLYKLFGVNFVLLRGYCFALSTLTAVFAFLTVERASRRPWFAFLVALLVVVVPGSTFKNYMPLLAVTNSFCLLSFALGRRRTEDETLWSLQTAPPADLIEPAVTASPTLLVASSPQSQGGSWLWLMLGAIVLGLTFLIRIDVGTFFLLLWLGAELLLALRPQASALARFGLLVGGPIVTVGLAAAVHVPVYLDAERRGFERPFISQYIEWPQTLVASLRERLEARPAPLALPAPADTPALPAPAATSTPEAPAVPLDPAPDDGRGLPKTPPTPPSQPDPLPAPAAPAPSNVPAPPPCGAPAESLAGAAAEPPPAPATPAPLPTEPPAPPTSTLLPANPAPVAPTPPEAPAPSPASPPAPAPPVLEPVPALPPASTPPAPPPDAPATAPTTAPPGVPPPTVDTIPAFEIIPVAPPGSVVAVRPEKEANWNTHGLRPKTLADLSSAKDDNQRALIILRYAPLLTLIPLALWAALGVLRTRRTDVPGGYERSVAALLVLGGALTVFPQYFFFRSDAPHISEFSPGFWVGAFSAVLLLGWGERRRFFSGARFCAIVLLLALFCHAGLYLWRMLPDRWTGTIAARKNRNTLFHGQNGVDVYVSRKESEALQQLVKVVRDHSGSSNDYLIAYPYQPSVNLICDRRTYEKNVYVDNATCGPGWNPAAIARIQKYRPNIIVLSDWDINQTEDSRFSNWARTTKTWIQTNYLFQGNYLDFEIFTRPEKEE